MVKDDMQAILRWEISRQRLITTKQVYERSKDGACDDEPEKH